MGKAPLIERLQAAAVAVSGGQLSYEAIRELVCQALCDAAGQDCYCYIVDCFPDKVVYELKEHYFERTYSIADGKVSLGDATEVERQVSYTPLKAACEFIGAAADSNGMRWPVRVIAYGPDKQGRTMWEKAPLVAALNLFEGAKVFACNDSQHKDPTKAARFGKSPRELVGALTQPEVRDDGIYAAFVIMPSADWLSNDLKACEANQIDYVYGLSVDVTGKTKKIIAAGKNMIAPDVISNVQVDVVYDPIGGGKFLRAARESGQREEETMLIAQLLAALARRDSAEASRIQTAIDSKSITEPQAVDQIMAAMDKGTPTDMKCPACGTTMDKCASGCMECPACGCKLTADGQPAASIKAAASAELQEMRCLASSMTLDKVLTASKLPEPVQDKLRASFAGTVFTEDKLQAAVKLEKETLDKLTASGQVRGVGEVRVVRETGEKLQAAVDGLFHVPVADSMKDVPVFTSIRAAYAEITGDSEVRGYQDSSTRMQAAFDTSTFAYLLGNALYRRMVADYRETSDFGLSRLISNVRNARDFRPLQAIRIAYFGDIPDVNPENLDYADLGTLSDEKMEYSLNQKGGIITITRKMIINDDMTGINRIVSRLPRAARRTKAKRAWGKLINNDTYKGDSVATFHASHNNLGSTAYALASAVAARTAIAKQTEPGSGERLYLRPVTLAIPTDLWDAAVTLNQNSAVTTGNSMYQFFGTQNEGIIEVPFMTDVNDWMMFADPKDVEILEVAYLNGQQEPEMFVADQPTVGQFFVGDKLQYKIRDEYEFEIMDFRGGYKAVVAG